MLRVSIFCPHMPWFGHPKLFLCDYIGSEVRLMVSAATTAKIKCYRATWKRNTQLSSGMFMVRMRYVYSISSGNFLMKFKSYWTPAHSSSEMLPVSVFRTQLFQISRECVRLCPLYTARWAALVWSWNRYHSPVHKFYDSQ